MISVVITTCRRPPEMLRRAVDSVRNQSYTDWELIVVDDSPASYGKRQAVQEMLEELRDERIRYIPHSENRGACAARNTGLEAAAGEYIAYLDDDDEWLPDKLKLQEECLRNAGSDVALVYCGAVVQNDSTGKEKEQKLAVHRGQVFDSLILFNYIGSTSYPLIRTECLRETGGFDAQMQSAQDADAWLRLAVKYEVECVPKPLVRYHVHGGERISAAPKKKIQGLERLNEKHREYIETHREAYWSRNIKIAPFYACDRQLGKALRYWFRAAVKCPRHVKMNLVYLAGIIAGRALYAPKK